MERKPRSPDWLIVKHIPHCADPDHFRPSRRSWQQRDIPCLLTGVTGSEFYPLRTRLAALIRSGRIPGTIHPHPGYRLTADECRRQERAYADVLGRSKLVLCTASRFGYGLAKYPEAAMAGAAIAGELTPDFEGTLNPHIIPLGAEQSDQELVDTVLWALQDDAQLERNATALLGAAEESLTTERYATRMVEALQEAVGGIC